MIDLVEDGQTTQRRTDLSDEQMLSQTEDDLRHGFWSNSSRSAHTEGDLEMANL